MTRPDRLAEAHDRLVAAIEHLVNGEEWQRFLDTARRFRSYYSRWQEYRRANNRDEIASMEGRMRDVMNHHNVPSDVSYDEMMNVLSGYNQN